jgi:DNA-binding protein YbaB
MAFDPIPDPSTLLGAIYGIERQLALLDQQLDAARSSGASPDGAVTAVANGTPLVISVTITPAALAAAASAGNLGPLAASAVVALNQALGSAQDASATTTGNLDATLSLQGICAPNAALPNVAGFTDAAAALTGEVPIIDQRIAARRFQGQVGAVTAVVDGHFQVISVTIAGFPRDAAALGDQVVRAVNLGIGQVQTLVDQTVDTTAGNIGQNKAGFADLCLYARGSLKLEDRVKVVTSAGGRAAIGNAGNTGTNIGVSTQTGNIWSMAPVFLSNNAHIVGFVKSNQAVTSQTTPPDVSAGVFPGTFVQLPNLSLQVTFPSKNSGDILQDVNAKPLTLKPGAYNNVTVKAPLTLTAGTYTFETLDFEPQGTLTIDSRAGRVIVYVHGGNLIFRGKQTSASGQPNFVLGYFGTGMVTVGAAFTGTMIAPTALIDLATIASPGYTGAFFAKDIDVHPDVTITFVPYTGTPSLGTF